MSGRVHQTLLDDVIGKIVIHRLLREHEREERIDNEIVVDCDDEYERYSGWWNYLSDELRVPFRSRSIIDSVQTVLKKHEEVEVIEVLDSIGEE